MSQELIYQFLKDTLGVKVHQDMVPETAQLPAASYYIVSEPAEGAMKGGVDLRRYNATCDIVTNSRTTTNEYANKLKAFENFTTGGDFQLIRLTNVNQTPRADSNVKLFQTSIDLEFTMRRSEL